MLQNGEILGGMYQVMGEIGKGGSGIIYLGYHLRLQKQIVIKTIDGVKIGYVPRYDNAIFSRLMDAGKLLFGRISSKEGSGRWVRINIKVYLHE